MQSLMAITHQTHEQSLQWLEENEWNLQKSINRWLDDGGGGGGGGRQPARVVVEEASQSGASGSSKIQRDEEGTEDGLLADRARLDRLISEGEQDARNQITSVRDDTHRLSRLGINTLRPNQHLINTLVQPSLTAPAQFHHTSSQDFDILYRGQYSSNIVSRGDTGPADSVPEDTFMSDEQDTGSSQQATQDEGQEESTTASISTRVKRRRTTMSRRR